MSEGLVHHMAFRLAEALPICGADSERMSLQAEHVTCPECRRICQLGPAPEPEEVVA